MKKYKLIISISVFFKYIAIACLIPVTASAVSFPDIHHHWAESWINKFSNQGYIQGYPDGLFRPDQEITRKEADNIITRFETDKLAGLSTDNIDLSSDYLPQDNITREESFKIVAQSIEKVNGYVPDTSSIDLDFNDHNTVDIWAADYAKQLIEYGTLDGYPDNTVKGKDNITRSEFVKLLYSDIPQPQSYTISGLLAGLPNNQGATVEYTLNGAAKSVITDSNGLYSISAPKGTNVVITAPLFSGYAVLPGNYNIDAIAADLTGKDFTYTSSGGGSGGGTRYNVTYNSNGGNGSYFDGNILPATDYTIKSDAETGIFRSEYSFVNWNTVSDGSGTAYTPGDVIRLSENITLYAQWSYAPSAQYTVIYDSNGGSGFYLEPGITSGTLYQLKTANEAGVDLYLFELIYWNTQPDGSGTNYTPGEIISITNDLTLYAQWAFVG